MNIVLRITESTVAMDVPGFHRVFARGTGVEQFCDLFAAPRHGQKLGALISFDMERLMRTIGSPFAMVTGLPFFQV